MILKQLNKEEAEELLYECGPFAPEAIGKVWIGSLLRHYRFDSAWQYVYDGDITAFAESLEAETLPVIPDGCKATVVFECTSQLTLEIYCTIKRSIQNWVGKGNLMDFEQIRPSLDRPFDACATIIIHSAERRRDHYDEIFSSYHYMVEKSKKIAEVVDREIERNEKVGAVVRLETGIVADFIKGHLLWSEIASSMTGANDLFGKLRDYLRSEMRDYDVRGLFLFFEMDKQYTTMGEIEKLKESFAGLLDKGAEVLMNVRLTDSCLKFITCRAVLVGNPPYMKGTVYQHSGSNEILLYEDEDSNPGHIIVASYDTNKEFCISRYDWDIYDYSIRKLTDDHYYFDSENTDKLFTALNVKAPADLLLTIRQRFASDYPAQADSILDFCRSKGIKFTSDYHY